MVSKRDRYKRLISVCSATVLVGILALGFGYVWYTYYSDAIVLPYYRRGNWVLIGIYAMLVWLFFRVYGGFKLGYLKKTDMLYSQLISIAAVDFVAYFLISLIGRDFMPVMPMVLLTFADFGYIAV